MARLIDAEALKDLLIETLEHIAKNPTMTGQEIHIVAGCHMLCEMIVDAPTIDAVPVVHARWVKDRERNTYCSHCEKYIPAVHFHEQYQDYESEWDEEIEETEFCPNCGVKMDGGAADG
jgi:hypothetical protein